MRQEKKKDLRLIFHTRSNNIKSIKKLILEGININVQDRYGYTALMDACLWEHTEIVRLLLEANADLDIQDNEFRDTALIAASKRRHTEIVRLLLEANADPDIQNRYGTTAFTKASWWGYTEIVKLLLEANPHTNGKYAIVVHLI